MKSVGIAAFTVAALGAGSACADATLVYRSTGPDAGVVETTLSVSRFFVRVDASDRENEYLLFQAGKYFPLYRVDTAAGQYVQLSSSVDRPAPAAASPGQAAPPPGGQAGAGAPTVDPTPTFRPTRNIDRVAGVACRVVFEVQDGGPPLEHCMANKANLRITERESRTLARLFVLLREQGYGWLGAATADEDFVSVRSIAAGGPTRTLELQSASIEPLTAGYLKMPSGYREISVDAPPAGGGPAGD